MTEQASPPLIVHVVHRFATGGLENGLVNLVNSLPADLARHHILCLVGADQTFAARIRTNNCTLEALDANPDRQSLRLLPLIFHRFRSLQPAIVHTRNIATIECQYAAWLARVPRRIHGEHGWDVADQYGSNARYTHLRRVTRYIVHREVALSQRTVEYLHSKARIPLDMITEIPNGVDTQRFSPQPDDVRAPLPEQWPFAPNNFILGTVGRLSAIKNQTLLCEAFCHLRQNDSDFMANARLVIVGNGPDKEKLEHIVDSHGATDAVWFAGDRDDVPSLLRRMDVFCLPSRAEGLSNSILEAMATGLPVVATDVGGNSEQIEHKLTGKIVSSQNIEQMADAIRGYFKDSELRLAHSCAARQRAESVFGLRTMVNAYQKLYSELLDKFAGTSERIAQGEQ